MPQVEWIPRDALIVVDVQNDFFEKGTLPVPGAEAIVPLDLGVASIFTAGRSAPAADADCRRYR
jgi:nicotinamidase-related amidase